MDTLRIYPQLYLLRDMLDCTIGQDENVKIGELLDKACDLYEICIWVKGESRAEAMRILVPYEYNYGNTKVIVKLFCEKREIIFPCVSQKSERHVAQLFCRALDTNRLFIGTVLGPERLLPVSNEIKVFIKKEWIYFYGTKPYEQLAADVFSQVIKLKYGLFPMTTVDFCTYEACHCMNKRWYCGKYA